MKWLKRLLGLVLIGIVYLIAPVAVSAGTTEDITITAIGVVVGTASDFTVTYIDDHTVGLSWTMPPGADKIKIMAKYDSYPTAPAPGAEPTDGWELYYDNGTSTQDTAVNLDEMFKPMYYRAWVQAAGGAWSPLYVEGNVEGPGMTLLAGMVANFLSLLIAAALVAVAFWQRSNFLQILAGFVAIGFGIYWITVDPNFLYVIEAVAVVGVGLYMMLMVGVDYLKGG